MRQLSLMSVAIGISAAIGVILAGSPALAVDLGSRASMNKHQLAVCMIKRMRADPAVSYLDAKRTCTVDIDGRGAGLAASNSPGRGERPSSPAKPGS